MRAHLDNALQITHSTSKDASSIIGITCHHPNGTPFQGVLVGWRASSVPTMHLCRIQYHSVSGRSHPDSWEPQSKNSIAFPTPRRRSMQMICIEEDAGSCIDQASPYDSLPPMCPCKGLDFPPSQITCREKVSPIEITNDDLAGESTIVAAMSMKVLRGSLRAMHKSNACVGQMGEGSSHKFIYTSHQSPYVTTKPTPDTVHSPTPGQLHVESIQLACTCALCCCYALCMKREKLLIFYSFWLRCFVVMMQYVGFLG